MYILFLVFFCVLFFFTIVDPGNTIFGLKEISFLLTFVCGGIIALKYPFSLRVLIIYVLSGLLIPIYGLLLGLLSDNYFCLEIGLMYVKSFLFLSLILVSYNYGIVLSKLFSIFTLLIVFLTLIILYIVVDIGPEMFFFLDKNTVVISRRAFGPLLIDPCIFYKTSPLLIFGLAFLCQKNRFKYHMINMILIILCLYTFFISGTRANMISAFLICIFYLWNNYIKFSKYLRYFFISFSMIFGLFILPYLFLEIFFASDEPSAQAKQSMLVSYFDFWQDNSIAFLFGQGLGSGIETTIRGIEYLLEPTYFELLRFWGILLFPIVFFLLLLLPLYYFYLNRKSNIMKENSFMVLAYSLYVFLEIPSNPLLLSSTGMVVFVMAFSSAYKIHLINHCKRD